MLIVWFPKKDWEGLAANFTNSRGNHKFLCQILFWLEVGLFVYVCVCCFPGNKYDVLSFNFCCFPNFAAEPLNIIPLCRGVVVI